MQRIYGSHPITIKLTLAEPGRREFGGTACGTDLGDIKEIEVKCPSIIDEKEFLENHFTGTCMSSKQRFEFLSF